jgi:hypothetical protein
MTAPPPPTNGLGDLLAAAADRVEAAVRQFDAGTIDEHELQRRCLDAGIVRHDGVAYIWDWVNGIVYGYDGFRLVTMEGSLPGPASP